MRESVFDRLRRGGCAVHRRKLLFQRGQFLFRAREFGKPVLDWRGRLNSALKPILDLFRG